MIFLHIVNISRILSY